MAEDLVINDRLRIAGSELDFSFARSSGPGGQHVNKTSTKAVLHWNVRHSESLPDPVRQRFCDLYSKRINTQGELVLSSDRHREQGRNVDECRQRLKTMVASVARPPKRRKPTRPSRAARQRRLQEKRQHSEKKQRRRVRPRPDD